MNNVFITDIKIIKCRNVSDIEISLNKEKHQHLILTGKNGSGKTSLLGTLSQLLEDDQKKGSGYSSLLPMLENAKENLESINAKPYYSRDDIGAAMDDKEIRKEAEFELWRVNDWIRQLEEKGIVIEYNADYKGTPKAYQVGGPNKFIQASFSSNRDSNSRMQAPTNISHPNLELYSSIEEGANYNFISYLVGMKAKQSFAYVDGDTEVHSKIKEWFDNFLELLKDIFDDSELKLEFRKDTFKFDIVEGDGNTFDFHTMSHGYSALISIISELITRMEAFESNTMAYDMQGIVLIDEIETHLHVDLQKKILPLLIGFFPNIQFIVSTHSPFVVSSVSNAVVCDLEKKIVTEDLSGYSYDVLLESLFGVNLISSELKTKLDRYDTLYLTRERTQKQKEEYKELVDYLLSLPQDIPNELSAKLKSIKISQRSNLGR